MIKAFRPFWSYDVQKTEKWLSSMAEKGLHLERVNVKSRCFYFRQGEEKAITYRVNYDKKQVVLPRTLQEDGWKYVTQPSKWSILANKKHKDQVKNFTNRDGIIKKNRNVLFIYAAILFYLSFIAVMNLAIIGVFFTGTTVEVVESPLWFLTYTLLAFAILLFVLSAYSVFKILDTNKALFFETLTPSFYKVDVSQGLSKQQEKELKRNGKLIVKRNFIWNFAPDKLEKWLETMEERGLHLYNVSQMKKFYFLRGKPRKIRYCVDFQNTVSQDYLDIHRDAGWKSISKNYDFYSKWTIWMKEYTDETDRPELYTDKSNLVQHSKRVAIQQTLVFLPLFIITLLVFKDNVSLLKDNKNIPIIFITVTTLLLLVIYGHCFLRTWSYFFRIRKHK